MINKKGNTMKVKEWAYEEAEKAVDAIIEKYQNKKINYDQAEKDILAVQNVDMLGIDEYNVCEVL
jgi:hypothetical protein